MSNDQNIVAIRALLESEAVNSPTILGAKLGSLIRTNLPDVNIKENFGSIKKLIESYFSDILQLSGRSGTDLLYKFVSQNSVDVISIPILPTTPQQLAKAGGKIYATKSSAIKQPNATDIETDLRETLKVAIDLMSSEQLRQLIVPVGILYDAISKKNCL